MTDVRHHELSLSCGSKIQVFDNLFSWQEKEYLFHFVACSLYTVQTGASAGTSESFERQMVLQSVYDKNDEKNFGLIYLTNVANYVNNVGNPARSWVNVTLPGCWIHQHSDGNAQKNNGQVTLMYCASFRWEKHFGGDTIFCNKLTGEKERVVEYQPGRLILFESCIPHITTLTIPQALPRYMYVCLFEKDKND